MKQVIKDNFKHMVYAFAIIISVTIIGSMSFSYAANNENGTIYTRDELSELIKDVNSEIESEKTKTTDLQSRTSLLESSISPLTAIHSKDIRWVDISSNVNTSVVGTIYEYLRYTIIGKVVILDIGGVTFKTAGRGQLWLTLPSSIIPNTRNVTTISNDSSLENQMAATSMVYNAIGSTNILVHVSLAGVSYYGQMIWTIN